jgi:hypothetical protein
MIIIPFIGGGFVIACLIGLSGLGLLVIWYRINIIHAIIAVLVGFCAIVSYLVLTRPKEVTVHDPPSAEDIQNAITPIRRQLEVTAKELASAGVDADSEKQRADKLDLNVVAARNETVEARRAKSTQSK